MYPEASNWVYQVVDFRDDKVIDSFTGYSRAYLDAKSLADQGRFWEVRIA